MKASSDDIQYCTDIARRYDEDWYLAAGFSAQEKRPALYILQAFFAEIFRIPESVTEPPLGEIRLQWWRDALKEVFGPDKVRAHPVVTALADTPDIADNPKLQSLMKDVIDETGFLMTGESFATKEQALRFFDNTYGKAAYAAAGLLSPQEAINPAGGVFAMTRFLARGKGEVLTSRNVPLAVDRLAALVEREGRDQMISWLKQEVDMECASLKGLHSDVMPAMAHLSLSRGYVKDAAINTGNQIAKKDVNALKRRLVLFKTVLTGRF